MILKLVKLWEENKHKLEEYFRTTDQKEYASNYEQIVKKLFEHCFPETDDDGFDLSRMSVINDGEYQGTLLFIIPKNVYTPSVEDYVMTHTYYGSCSGCDILQGIYSNEDGLSKNEQVKEYMTLALHLVQRLKQLA